MNKVGQNDSSMWRDLLAILIMSAAIICVLWSPKPMTGTDWSYDYNVLHKRRMAYARQALFESHTLPDWYSRELLGTPFWSNVSNFPFLPNRLLILLAMDPYGRYTWTASVILSALLTGLFTYLFCRRISAGRIAAAAAGFTFACCGCFIQNTAAGRMAILEGFCVLPMLLWSIESLVQAKAGGRSRAPWIGALTLSATYAALTGNPQLPIYSMITAALYALWRGSWRSIGAMILGVACAAFAIVPMLLLIAQSTRFLPLDPDHNDVAMPYGRLLGFFLPWLDGAPPPLARSTTHGFNLSYGTFAVFWDTYCYTGWLPWIACVALLIWMIVRRRPPQFRSVAFFIAVLAPATILLSLPIVRPILALVPGIVFRSPARIVYLTQFALAIALAGAVQLALHGSFGKWLRYLVPVALLLHGVDLGLTDREFFPRSNMDIPESDPAIVRALASVGQERVGMDFQLDMAANRTRDDVGFYDSIMLARPYRFLLDLSGLPAKTNTEHLDACQLSSRALESCGVGFLFTAQERGDLIPVARIDDAMLIYRTARPLDRAEFFSANRIHFVDEQRIHALLQNPAYDLHIGLPVDRKYQPLLPASTTQPVENQLAYRRPDSDHIECDVTTSQSGLLRIIESWASGWSATVDGVATPTLPAADALLAVPVGPGTHRVRLAFTTPGAKPGLIITLLSLVGLGVWMAIDRRVGKHQSATALRIKK